jgi:DNA-binding transcriptional LysR family regulator
MELRHLRYFVAVAEKGGFVRAARELHVAQPALSRQIRDLEREVGVELIDRDPKSTRLTPGGEAVLHEARAILNDVTHAIDRARQARRGLAGPCALGVGKLPTWSGIVAGLLAAMRRDSPMVHLDVSEAVTRTQWTALTSGKFDLGIGAAPTREFGDLQWQRITTLIFDAAVLPASHPLASRASIRLAELATEPIIAGFRADSDHHRMCVKVARRADPPTPIRIAESVPDGHALIATGEGWTPFLKSLAPWATQGTTVVSVEDLDVAATLYVIWKRDSLSAVARTVRETLIELAREMQPGSSERAARLPRRSASEGDADHPPTAPLAIALELRHLRYFLTVMREPSIGQAAVRLAITQPTLSRQMRDLERVVGVELLERRTRGAVATAAGIEFATIAERILDRVDVIAPAAQRATRGASGRCLVATIPAALVEPLLGSLLHRVATELTEVQVGLVDIPPSEQPEALVSGHIDIAICHSFIPITPYLDRLQSDRLLDDAIRCALLARDHPLAGREEITLAELGDLPFLFMPRSLYPAFYDQVLTLFAAHGFRPRIDQPYHGLETMWSLARRGEGWCIAFHRSLRAAPAGLAAVRVRELDLPWGIDMLYRRDESRPTVLGLTRLIRSTADVESAQWQPEATAMREGVGYAASNRAPDLDSRPHSTRSAVDDIGPRTK